MAGHTAGLDLDKMFSRTIADTRRFLPRLFPLFLAITVIVNLANNALLGQMGDLSQQSGLWVPLLLVFCFAFFAFGIQIMLAAQAQDDGVLQPVLAIAVALRKLPLVLLILVIYYVAVVIGTLLLIIPGVILAVTLGYSWFFVLLDGHGPIDALRDSFKLIWGNAWQMVGANVLLMIAYAALFGLMVFLLPGTFAELMEMLAAPGAYGDWRRWVFDLIGVPFAVVYLFLNLHIFRELKRLKDADSAAPAVPATITA